MTVHAFVDESRRDSYITCATIVSPHNLRTARAALRGMLLQGQRSLHFGHESPQRRRSLLTAMSQLPVRAHLYISGQKELVARRLSIANLLTDLIALNGRRLVIEHREPSQDLKERSQIAAAVRRGMAPASLEYEHLARHQEPLLWVSDAVAWAYGAGGDGRRRVAGLTARVVDVDEAK